MVGQTFTSMLVDDIDDAEDDGNSDDDVSLAVLAGRVTKRKRAPPTKGPCEHGVKQRSKCKVCSACPHGRQRSQVQGVRWVMQSASTVVSAQMQGVRWVINLRARSSALSVQGVRWVSNLRARSSALSVQGVRWVCNLRARSSAL